MRERNRNRWVLAVALPMLCALLLTSGACWGVQEEDRTDDTKTVAIKKFRPRLPAYFSAVVTTDQRKEIYDVQATYHEKLVALEEQIAKLKADRDKEVDAVLTAEQLVEVNEKRAAAAAKRKSRSSPKEETAADAEAATSSG